MNINDEIKVFQDCRQQCSSIANKLSGAATGFYQQLLPVSRFISALPNVLYKKQALQQQSMNLIRDIDNLMYNLKQLDVDCSIQIQSLIARSNLERMRKGYKNAKSTNAGLVRRTGGKRSKANN